MTGTRTYILETILHN